MGEVLHLHQRCARHTSIGGPQFERANVRAGFAHGLGEIGIQAASVGRLNGQSNHKPLTLALLPVDVEPSLRLVREEEEVWTVPAVDTHTAPPRDVADHLVARYRLAALRVAHHQAVDTLNTNPLRRARPFHAVEQPLQRAWLERGLVFLVDVRIHGAQYLRDVHIALADGCEEMVLVVERERLHGDGHLLMREPRMTPALELALQDVLADAHGCRLLLVPQPLANAMPGTPGAHVRQPVATRPRVRRADDLDRLGVLQFAREGHDATIDLRALRVQADLRVHRKREVDGRGTAGQLMHIAIRREHEDLVLIQVEFQELEKLIGRFRIKLQFKHLPEPLECAFQVVLLGAARLVAPVRGDAVVRRAVHFARADLDFEQRAARTEYRGVQRLVAVRLGTGDVVLDALLQRCPLAVNHAEGVVALLHAVDEHANGHEVVDLLVWLVASRHLLVDGPEVLGPAAHLVHHDAGLLEPLAQRVGHLGDEILAFLALLYDQLGQRLVFVGFEELEREIFEFGLEFREAEAVRQRRIQVARLLRDALALLDRHELQRSHVVEPVGELDQNDARIFRDRQEQLAIVLDLPLLRARQREVADFRETVDNLRDFPAEDALDFLDGRAGVLHHVMDEATRDGDGVELQFGEDLRHFHAVRDERVAVAPHLAGVRLLAEAIRAGEQIDIEALAERLAAEIPARDNVGERGGGHWALSRGAPHNRWRTHQLSSRQRAGTMRYMSPASEKLRYRPRPTTT